MTATITLGLRRALIWAEVTEAGNWRVCLHMCSQAEAEARRAEERRNPNRITMVPVHPHVAIECEDEARVARLLVGLVSNPEKVSRMISEAKDSPVQVPPGVIAS